MKRKPSLFSFILVLLVLIITVGYGSRSFGELTTEQVIKDIQKKASDIISYKATWVGSNVLRGQEVTASGIMSFKKPKYMRISYTPGECDWLSKVYSIPTRWQITFCGYAKPVRI